MEDKELAENHAPNAQIGLMDGNNLYTPLDPRHEVSTGNQPKEVFEESKTEESVGKEKMVRELLEVIEDSTGLKSVVFGKDVTHPERKRGIVQSVQTSMKLSCEEEEMEALQDKVYEVEEEKEQGSDSLANLPELQGREGALL